MRARAFSGVFLAAALLLFGLLPQTGAAAAQPWSDTIEAEISRPWFAEPLLRSAPTSAAEDRALLRAVEASGHRPGHSDGYEPLVAFLAAHPNSGWRIALMTNLGIAYLRDGYFSRALDAWGTAWREGRTVTDYRAKALVDRAVGERRNCGPRSVNASG